MSVLRKTDQQEIMVPMPMKIVMKAFADAGAFVGKVTEQREMTRTMVVRVNPTGFSNPATVRVSFEGENEQTRVRFQSGSLDGLVGFGSAEKAINALIGAADGFLSGNPPVRKKVSGPALIAIVVIALIAFSAFVAISIP